MSHRSITIISAMTKQQVIGKAGALPWNIPEEMKVFRKHTLGAAVVMGHNTYLSIGKPLQGRLNFVISTELDIQGATVCEDLEEALARARETGKEVFVIGGAHVYAQALPLADKLIISWLKDDYEGDTYFPQIKKDEWEIISREEHEAFETITYERSKE
jgi:dihydrofolate reductase